MRPLLAGGHRCDESRATQSRYRGSIRGGRALGPLNAKASSSTTLKPWSCAERSAARTAHRAHRYSSSIRGPPSAWIPHHHEPAPSECDCALVDSAASQPDATRGSAALLECRRPVRKGPAAPCLSHCRHWRAARSALTDCTQARRGCVG